MDRSPRSKKEDREEEEELTSRIEAKFTVCEPAFEGVVSVGTQPSIVNWGTARNFYPRPSWLTFQHRPLAAIIGRITDLDNAILYYSEISFLE